MKLKHHVLRLLGVVSPSDAYPLPPRWAMSKLGRSRWYPDQRRNLTITPPSDVTALWAEHVAAGPFPVRAQQEAQTPVCGPDSCYGHYDASGLPRGGQSGCGA